MYRRDFTTALSQDSLYTEGSPWGRAENDKEAVDTIFGLELHPLEQKTR